MDKDADARFYHNGTEGTLHIGDFVYGASQYFGKSKAMTNEHWSEECEQQALHSPVQVLGLVGAPTTGDKNKRCTNKKRKERYRQQTCKYYIREQGMRAKTLP